MNLKSSILYFSACIVSLSLHASEPEYTLTPPDIHGVIRTRYELETSDGEGRFQVRNARLSIGGKVAPVISYFVQVDACDRGKMKFLDAWGRFDITKELKLQAGQFREPFGVDNFRAPANYYFANRSFLGKTVCNVRGVGAKLMYNFSSLPLGIEAGVFNSESNSDHEVWSKKPAFASKVVYRIGNVALATGFQSLQLSVVRMNLVDGCVTWSNSDWIVEGEYMLTTYAGSGIKDCHTYNFFVNRSFPVNFGVFNRSSLQARFDGHTTHSNGLADADGVVSVTTPSRNRITAGGTLTYVLKDVRADIRLNYEKYLYHHGVVAAQGQGDKVVAELVVKF